MLGEPVGGPQAEWMGFQAVPSVESVTIKSGSLPFLLWFRIVKGALGHDEFPHPAPTPPSPVKLSDLGQTLRSLGL